MDFISPAEKAPIAQLWSQVHDLWKWKKTAPSETEKLSLWWNWLQGNIVPKETTLSMLPEFSKTLKNSYPNFYSLMETEEFLTIGSWLLKLSLHCYKQFQRIFTRTTNLQFVAKKPTLRCLIQAISIIAIANLPHVMLISS